MLFDLLKRILYRVGALDAYHRIRNRRALTVVMYHRVLSPVDPRWNSSNPAYTLSEEVFRQSVRFFKRHYNIVGLDQVIGARQGTSRLPARPLLITFDDGWSDNAEYALPVLRHEGVPAALFAVSDAVGRDRPFFQEEIFAGWRTGKLTSAELRRIGTSAGIPDHAMSVAEDELVDKVIAGLEALTEEDRRRVLAPYADRLGDGLKHMVSVQDLRQLREGGVTVGIHGKTHTPLTRVSDVDVELVVARADVARLLGAPESELATLSFPHGRWTAEIAERARHRGYALMFTSVPALNSLEPGCPDVLGRMGVDNFAQDRQGRFRPDWLALYLFRGPVRRLS